MKKLTLALTVRRKAATEAVTSAQMDTLLQSLWRGHSVEKVVARKKSFKKSLVKMNEYVQ